MKRSILILTLLGLVPACGGGGGDGSTAGASVPSSPTATPESSTPEDAAPPVVLSPEGSAPTGTVNSASLDMMTDAGEEVTIPPDVESTATNMSELKVPDGFSYDSVDALSMDVDISEYTTARGYLSIYGVFSTKEDGSYVADYNSRITATDVVNGKASLSYPVSDSQYYMLAEVYFYDGTTPIQTRLNYTQSSWVW